MASPEGEPCATPKEKLMLAMMNAACAQEVVHGWREKVE